MTSYVTHLEGAIDGAKLDPARPLQLHEGRPILVQAGASEQGREIAAGSTVANLLGELGVTQPHVAVEVNLEVVPRAQHRDTILIDGDRVEVVTLVGGG